MSSERKHNDMAGLTTMGTGEHVMTDGMNKLLQAMMCSSENIKHGTPPDQQC